MKKLLEFKRLGRRGSALIVFTLSFPIRGEKY